MHTLWTEPYKQCHWEVDAPTFPYPPFHLMHEERFIGNLYTDGTFCMIWYSPTLTVNIYSIT